MKISNTCLLWDLSFVIWKFYMQMTCKMWFPVVSTSWNKYCFLFNTPCMYLLSLSEYSSWVVPYPWIFQRFVCQVQGLFQGRLVLRSYTICVSRYLKENNDILMLQPWSTAIISDALYTLVIQSDDVFSKIFLRLDHILDVKCQSMRGWWTHNEQILAINWTRQSTLDYMILLFQLVESVPC